MNGRVRVSGRCHSLPLHCVLLAPRAVSHGGCSQVSGFLFAGQMQLCGQQHLGRTGQPLALLLSLPCLVFGEAWAVFVADKWKVQAGTGFFFIEVPVDELAAFLLRKVFKRLFTHLDIFTAFITQLHPGVFRLFILWFTERFQESGPCPVLCSSAACWINLSGKHGCQSWTIPCS